MGKPRNPRFVSFFDKVALKQLLLDIRPLSDDTKVEDEDGQGEFLTNPTYQEIQDLGNCLKTW